MKKIIFGLVVVFAIFFIGSLFFQKPQVQQSTLQTKGITTDQKVSNETKTYSLKDIAGHADNTSCWTAINGKVYDLTSFVSQHPGGPFRILSICGKDGSAAFTAQHGGQARPADELSSLYIGDLTSE